MKTLLLFLKYWIIVKPHAHEGKVLFLIRLLSWVAFAMNMGAVAGGLMAHRLMHAVFNLAIAGLLAFVQYKNYRDFLEEH